MMMYTPGFYVMPEKAAPRKAAGAQEPPPRLVCAYFSARVAFAQGEAAVMTRIITQIRNQYLWPLWLLLRKIAFI